MSVEQSVKLLIEVEDLQIWKVTANMLDKQWRPDDKDRGEVYRLWADNFSAYEPVMVRTFTWGHGLERTFEKDLRNRNYYYYYYYTRPVHPPPRRHQYYQPSYAYGPRPIGLSSDENGQKEPF
jgi:hypothetical protein